MQSTFSNCLTMIQAESIQVINMKVEDHNFLFPEHPRSLNLNAYNSSYEFWKLGHQNMYEKHHSELEACVWHWCSSYFEDFFHNDLGISKTHVQHRSYSTPCPLSIDTKIENFEQKSWNFRRLKERIVGCITMTVSVEFSSWQTRRDILILACD